MIPYQIGDTVTFQLGDRAYTGRVSGVTVQSIEITVPMDLPLGATGGTLRWPDQQAQPLDLATTIHQTQLVLRLPMQSVPQPAAVQRPAPPDELPRGAGQAELRRSVRIPIELDVRLVDVATQAVIAAQTLDVSSGGVRLATTEQLVVGREYLVSLPLGEEPYELKARVLRKLVGNLYALKFLVEREVGHRLMRALFVRVRGDMPAAKSRSMNFRRSG